MSMDICKDCDRLVDTDDDCDCYVEVGNMRNQTQFICLCEPCRWRREEQAERDAREPDPDAQREAKRDNADWDRQCGWDKEPNEGEF